MRAALAARDENPIDRKLFADVKFLDDLAISINVFFREILEKASPFSHKLQQAKTAMMVFLVPLQVRGQHVDMGCQDGNLNFRASGVRVTLPELLDDFRLLFFADRHCNSLK
jgi:hypothetical protein